MSGPLSLLRSTRLALTVIRQVRLISYQPSLRKTVADAAHAHPNQSHASERRLLEKIEEMRIKTEKNTLQGNYNAERAEINRVKIEEVDRKIAAVNTDLTRTKTTFMYEMGVLKAEKANWKNIKFLATAMGGVGLLFWATIQLFIEHVNVKLDKLAANTREDMNKLDAKVDKLDAKVNELATNVTEIKTKVDGLATDVTEIKTTVSLLSNHLLGSHPAVTSAAITVEAAPPALAAGTLSSQKTQKPRIS